MDGAPINASGPDPVQQRFESILEIARLHDTGVPLEDLTSLLPASGPQDAGEVVRWLQAHPSVGELVANRAVRPGAVPSAAVLEERRARGQEYRRGAEALVGSTLAPVLGMVRCIGMTGSAAYLEPQAGDDLDLMVVTRAGALWFVLAYAYVAVRLRRPPGPTPHLCLNYVLDESEALREFSRPRGFLFAREALTLRPLTGESYYRALLSSAPWIAGEVPRMCARWGLAPAGAPPPADPAPLPIRFLSALLFPVVGAYLQFAGLVRNHRARRGRSLGQQFRTQTRWSRLAFPSQRFDDLRHVYGAGPGRAATGETGP